MALFLQLPEPADFTRTDIGILHISGGVGWIGHAELRTTISGGSALHGLAEGIDDSALSEMLIA